MKRNRSAKLSTDDTTRRPRALQAKVTNALARAFFVEWAKVGYAAISLERVAKKAGAGKAALYRRWPSKVAMASDLLLGASLTLTKVRDLGSLEADLRALLLEARRVLHRRLVQRILADLLVEVGRERQLEIAVQPFQKMRRDQVQQLIERAILRGELPPTVDKSTILDFLIGPIYWRTVVIHAKSDAADIERILRMTKAAMMVV